MQPTLYQVQSLIIIWVFRDGRDLITFGNILHILEFHKNYLTKGLREANHDPQAILDLFRKRKGDMKIRYGKFCNNKPKSELIVTQNQDRYFR